MYALTFLLTLFAVHFFGNVTYSQSTALVLSVGVVKADAAQKISLHPAFKAGSIAPIAKNINVYFSIGLSRDKSYWENYETDYLGKMYSGQNGQVFERWAFSVGLYKSWQSSFFAILAFSANRIRFKRIVYNEALPFFINDYTNAVSPIWAEDIDEANWIPGVEASIGIMKQLTAKLTIGLQVDYDHVFHVSHVYDKSRQSLNLLAFSPFLKIGF